MSDCSVARACRLAHARCIALNPQLPAWSFSQPARGHEIRRCGERRTIFDWLFLNSVVSNSIRVGIVTMSEPIELSFAASPMFSHVSLTFCYTCCLTLEKNMKSNFVIIAVLIIAILDLVSCWPWLGIAHMFGGITSDAYTAAGKYVVNAFVHSDSETAGYSLAFCCLVCRVMVKCGNSCAV